MNRIHRNQRRTVSYGINRRGNAYATNGIWYSYRNRDGSRFYDNGRGFWKLWRKPYFRRCNPLILREVDLISLFIIRHVLFSSFTDMIYSYNVNLSKTHFQLSTELIKECEIVCPDSNFTRTFWNIHISVCNNSFTIMKNIRLR